MTNATPLITLPRQREGHDTSARGCPLLSAAARDRYKLPPADLVHRRRRVPCRRQFRRPQQLAGGFVVCVKLTVENRRTDEQQAARRHHRTAIVTASGVL